MIRTTLLSAAALALAVSTPAVAQSGAAGSGADLDQVRESLGDADIEERRDFMARLVRADTADGETVYMLLTPRDLGSDGEVDVDLDDLRERLEAAGLTGIQPVENARFVIGDLDETAIVVMRGSDFGETIEVPATGTLGTGMDASGGMGTGGTMAPGGTAQPPIPRGTPDIAPNPGNPGVPALDVPGTTAPQ